MLVRADKALASFCWWRLQMGVQSSELSCSSHKCIKTFLVHGFFPPSILLDTFCHMNSHYISQILYLYIRFYLSLYIICINLYLSLYQFQCQIFNCLLNVSTQKAHYK